MGAIYFATNRDVHTREQSLVVVVSGTMSEYVIAVKKNDRRG